MNRTRTSVKTTFGSRNVLNQQLQHHRQVQVLERPVADLTPVHIYGDRLKVMPGSLHLTSLGRSVYSAGATDSRACNESCPALADETRVHTASDGWSDILPHFVYRLQNPRTFCINAFT